MSIPGNKGWLAALSEKKLNRLTWKRPNVRFISLMLTWERGKGRPAVFPSAIFPVGNLLPSLFSPYCEQAALSPWPLVWLAVASFAPCTSYFPGLSTGLLFIPIQNNADHDFDMCSLYPSHSSSLRFRHILRYLRFAHSSVTLILIFILSPYVP